MTGVYKGNTSNIMSALSKTTFHSFSENMDNDTDLGKLSKIKTTKHMEFSICWFTPPPPTYGKFFRDFLLSKNDF